MRPTNLLFIMADEHSRRVTGCYGNQQVCTPNIDALAARGTRFENAYCNTPICVPARATVATGRYGHQIDSWDNATPYTGEEAPSWGHRLTAHDHPVTTIGKLHYRQVGDPTGFADQRLPMHVLDGVGDLYGILRAEMPIPEPEKSSRRFVTDAGAGDSEYTRYDRAIAQASAKWLAEEAAQQTRPWALFVSFVSPHFPLVPPEEYFDMYAGEELPNPVQGVAEEWPQHPALELHRRQAGLHEPFTHETLQNALAAYYGLVSFVDAQVGVVLDALQRTGLADETRVIYTADHGDMVGEHGLWYKSALYEGAAGIPMIVSGPDVPQGKVVGTNVSQVDIFPSILDAVGVPRDPADDDLPGRPLWDIARAADEPRTIFAEYHAIYSTSGEYMLRDETYKYVHYVDGPPLLFDLTEDPDELVNLADDPRYESTVQHYQSRLQAILDVEDVDKRAKDDQRRRLDAGGGRAAVIARGQRVSYTPAPVEFGPEAR